MPSGRTPGPPQTAPVIDDLLRRDVSPVMAGLAVRIGAARVAKGWTYQQLSSEADVSAAIIKGIEQGERDPRYSTLVKLCRALGCSDLGGLLGSLPPAR